jgi:membrane protein implicated in regulation of membrane protease activity
MKIFMKMIASATFMTSPFFETPGEAVMFGLLAVIALIGVATVMSFVVSSSSAGQRPSPAQETAVSESDVRLTHVA